MEKEILEILKAIQLDITGIKDEQQKVNEKLDRIENDVEFETRINDFMIDKNVVSVQSLKDSVFVTYAD